MGVKSIENFQLKDIKRISFWGRLVGCITIIYGVIVALQGLFTSIIGALPGILAIFIGRFIYYSGAQAKALLQAKGKNLYAVDMLLNYMGLAFMLIGIIMGIFVISSGLLLLIVWLYY